MNKKSHITKQTMHDKPSSFAVEQKKREASPTEMTMSDIAKKLRYIHTQMQEKHSPCRVASQSLVKDDLKSYLDDISRAILAEYYIRRQKEKALFEHLEQIKTLVQSLQSKKISSQKTATAQPVSHVKSPASIVHHLAHMTCEESQVDYSFQKGANFSEKNNKKPIKIDALSVSQQSKKSALLKDAAKLAVKEDKELVHSAMKENYSDAQTSDDCIEGEQSSPSFKALFLRVPFFLRYFVKNRFTRFLTIAFMAAITLCFYSFLRESHFS
ncbi:hypothetical protein [Bartonella sp. B17]